MNVGTLVRIKEEYAFTMPIRYHYGEVVETNIDNADEQEIRLKGDLRYNHDSIIWTRARYYEAIK